MKITIESTDRLITVNGVQARIWQGRTESGTPLAAFVTRVFPTIEKDDPRCLEFERDLKECVAPRPELDPFTGRLVL